VHLINRKPAQGRRKAAFAFLEVFMSAANYPRCLANTLREEGGWTDDPRDPGGPTMRGIIQREYTKYRASKGLANRSVRYITEAELQDIYAGNYWRPMRGDLWPKGPDQIVFDIAVNSGPGRSLAIMRAAMGNPSGGIETLARLATQSGDKGGIVKRACARRASFYRSLRTFSVFGRGWLRRNARMEAIGVRMVLEAQGVSDMASALKGEVAGAQTKAKRGAQGATATGGSAGVGGGALSQADVGSWDWTVWLTLGLVAVGAIALTLVCLYLWRKHGERAKAYAAAIAGELETDLGTVLAKIDASTAK
jgi:lysozyme family protein